MQILKYLLLHDKYLLSSSRTEFIQFYFKWCLSTLLILSSEKGFCAQLHSEVEVQLYVQTYFHIKVLIYSHVFWKDHVEICCSMFGFSRSFLLTRLSGIHVYNAMALTRLSLLMMTKPLMMLTNAFLIESQASCSFPHPFLILMLPAPCSGIIGLI